MDPRKENKQMQFYNICKLLNYNNILNYSHKTYFFISTKIVRKKL
jgi:hypothetical protein